MTRTKPTKMPPSVRFLTEKREGMYFANVVVTMAAPGYGRTERAAMKRAAELLREGLDDLIADAMKSPSREA